MLTTLAIAASVLPLLTVEVAIREQEHAMTMTYIIDGGDGDQSFFASRHRLKMVSEDWFPGHLPRGAAILFKIVNDGEYSGRYVATTSRVQSSIESQLNDDGVASVIVHLIKNPSHSFDGTSKDAYPVGMSVLEVVNG